MPFCFSPPTEDFVTYSQTPILEQPLGIPFDSTDFTMNIAPTGTLFALLCSTSMENWTEEEEELDNSEDSKVDPDLEDETDSSDDNQEEEEDDDTFEQYLFGEDDE